MPPVFQVKHQGKEECEGESGGNREREVVQFREERSALYI